MAAAAQTPSPASVTVLHTISEKLDSQNYHLWQQRAEAVIQGHKLHHFLLNPQILVKFATVEDRNAGSVSEAYLSWDRQDQLLQ